MVVIVELSTTKRNAIWDKKKLSLILINNFSYKILSEFIDSLKSMISLQFSRTHEYGHFSSFLLFDFPPKIVRKLNL